MRHLSHHVSHRPYASSKQLGQLGVAVGTPVAEGPPHGSQRAQLAHWALASGRDDKAL